MLKLNKTQARIHYGMNHKIIIVPCKCRPDSIMALQMRDSFEARIGMTFDQFVNSFEYYNCNTETGRYAHFYLVTE